MADQQNKRCECRPPLTVALCVLRCRMVHGVVGPLQVRTSPVSSAAPVLASVVRCVLPWSGCTSPVGRMLHVAANWRTLHDCQRCCRLADAKACISRYAYSGKYQVGNPSMDEVSSLDETLND